MQPHLSLPIRAATLALVLLVVACASPIKRADGYIAQEEWMKAVIEYRKAYGKHPNNVEYKSRLHQVELKAADYYYQRGIKLVEQGNLDGAIVQFQQGLAAMPDHSKLQQAMNEALARKEAGSSYSEGASYQEAGKIEDAKRQYQRALQHFPNHKEAAAALALLQKEEEDKAADKFALSSRAPITLNFRQTELRTAFEFIAKSFGINVIFDEAVKSVPVTLFAKDVTFEQAINLLLNTTKTFYKRIGPTSILVAPDTKEKRGQYEDNLMRTFHLNTMKAKEMADILKGLLTIKKIIINENLNTLIVRDTEETLRLAEKVIENNDRKPAEMILEVEILEVNRSKAEKLGLDLGSYTITVPVPEKQTSFSAAKNAATLTLPSPTFRLFKQDVDAKTLANPKIRVINGKSAKIHIGDRVPLRAATIVDATGQTRTTYDYKEIGIRLIAEPAIHLDNSSTVKLGLEVSSLGANIGTQTEPAFVIGTRNADTFMLLRDGETAILGGLIRDEERNTRVKIPGLGDIPIVGSLFTSFDDSIQRTDVLLTITPRIVRGWEIASKADREFYSGSENVYSLKPLFADMSPVVTSETGTTVKPEIAIGAPPATLPEPTAPAAAAAAAAAPSATGLVAVPSAASGVLTLGFSEPVYEVAAGQEFEIKLVGENLSGAATLPMEILFNPQLLSYLSGEGTGSNVQSFNAEADTARGMLRVDISYGAATVQSGAATLARIRLRGTKPGISYLVYRSPAIKNAAGEAVNAQVRASRIVVK